MLLPGRFGVPSPQILTSMTDELIGMACAQISTGASRTWAANRANFYPFRIDQPRTFVKAFWLNGSVVAGNVDVGIFTISGTTATRVVASTAEAQATVSVRQVAATFTTTTLTPGLYYLALSASSASATFWTSNPAAYSLKPSCFQASSSHPLPSSVTVVAIANGSVPVFGLSELSSI